jgi:hypothetical protein
MRTKFQFDVLEDPLLDVSSIDLGLPTGSGTFPQAAILNLTSAFEGAPWADGNAVNPSLAAAATPPIQDPDIVVVPPVDPSPHGGPPIWDPNIVVTPPVQPTPTHTPVQDSAVPSFTPSLQAPVFSSAIVPQHTTELFGNIATTDFAAGATPPVQDPDIVVMPPVDPSPHGGPPIWDPDIVVTPPVPPAPAHTPVQDSAFLPAGSLSELQGAGLPGALPITANDWWFVS